MACQTDGKELSNKMDTCFFVIFFMQPQTPCDHQGNTEQILAQSIGYCTSESARPSKSNRTAIEVHCFIHHQQLAVVITIDNQHGVI
jgi:hypothetical protein